jgi:hypothetical protein
MQKPETFGPDLEGALPEHLPRLFAMGAQDAKDHCLFLEGRSLRNGETFGKRADVGMLRFYRSVKFMAW